MGELVVLTSQAVTLKRNPQSSVKQAKRQNVSSACGYRAVYSGRLHRKRSISSSAVGDIYDMPVTSKS